MTPHFTYVLCSWTTSSPSEMSFKSASTYSRRTVALTPALPPSASSSLPEDPLSAELNGIKLLTELARASLPAPLTFHRSSPVALHPTTKTEHRRVFTMCHPALSTYAHQAPSHHKSLVRWVLLVPCTYLSYLVTMFCCHNEGPWQKQRKEDMAILAHSSR